jgi:exo-1,4-beta-D-glucosaminidase
VTLDVETAVEAKGDETVVEVTARNVGGHLAFFVMLALTQGRGGPEVTPAFWSENAFSLLPGAQKTVTVRAYTRDLGRATPAIRVGGWNARAAE